MRCRSTCAAKSTCSRRCARRRHGARIQLWRSEPLRGFLKFCRVKVEMNAIDARAPYGARLAGFRARRCEGSRRHAGAWPGGQLWMAFGLANGVAHPSISNGVEFILTGFAVK